ncbi:MAG: alpha-L-glutamate ligase-like protein [Dissulfurispiraceae bacterium]
MIERLNHFKRVGVLGMNCRNSEYIMRYNPRSTYPLVDNKINTKQLAAKHNVPVPTLYYVINHHGDLANLEKIIGDRSRFVVKPSRGAGGSGIVLVTDRAAEGFIVQNGMMISQEDLNYHISDILSGIHSLSGLEDAAMIEALISPDPVFAAVSYEGIPDIRIVVYRGVPVMGMVRLPTEASDGKANLHRGAIGAGIDISSGRTGVAVHGPNVVTHHPDTGRPVGGIQVPYWEKILLIAALSFEMTGLGYLGVDVVIDREHGPLLLELNARPGLGIQIANMAGLRSRLETTDAAPPAIFTDPETRVSWAMREFIDKDRLPS